MKLAVVLLAISLLSLTGCGQTNTINNQETVVSEIPTETVSIVHRLGTTEVPKNPQRVVVLDFGALDVIDALGLQANIVGLPLSGSVPDYLESYNNEELYKNVGTVKEVDFEAIYALEPDLIISGARLDSSYEELSEIAPTVALNVENEDYLNTFIKTMQSYGELFDKTEEVNAKLDSFNKQFEAIRQKAAEKNANALIVLANGDTFSVYGKGSRFGIIHNEFGIAPVDETITVSTHGQNASFEYIVEQNPQLLFIVDRSAATGNEGSAKAMFDNELIHNIDAYKNNRIFYLNPTVWYVAGGGFTSTQIMLDEINEALDSL